MSRSEMSLSESRLAVNRALEIALDASAYGGTAYLRSVDYQRLRFEDKPLLIDLDVTYRVFGIMFSAIATVMLESVRVLQDQTGVVWNELRPTLVNIEHRGEHPCTITAEFEYHHLGTIVRICRTTSRCVTKNVLVLREGRFEAALWAK